ncbi:uncharacterized protein [Argopecten irradians]|uniref:uncharacterized protein n=1 Tax=Argopecten irradians TaxID=31199 RepID=UPI00371DCA8A
MDKVFQFYHATPANIKSLILQSGALVPQNHNPKEDWMWLLPPMYQATIPKGIWFCCTLFNGGLPTISPYGKHRVSLPIENVLQQLGGSIKLYHGKDSIVQQNKYVRLMLVKEGDNFECLKHMDQVNPFDNEWLQFNPNGQECLAAKRPMWVEIFCPYAISTKFGKWDEVAN